MSSCCQCAPPAEPALTADSRSIGWVRLALAAAVAGQSMIFGLAINLSPPTGPTRTMLHAGLAVSAIIVFLLLGGPLLHTALQAAARGRIIVEQLFLLGMFAAFGASLVSTVSGRGPVYYEVVAILLAVYTFGRTLGDRRRADALNAARALGGEFATADLVQADGTLAPRPARDIRPDDIIHVRVEGAIPVDGIVVNGSALVDESTLTGEPFPRPLKTGDLVLAGARLLDGPIRVRATAPGTDRALDALLTRVRAAQSRPSRLQSEADRLATWFLPLVLTIAALTFAGWTVHSGWTTGLFNALAVLLVACPCSLGLATPIGVWSALADLAARGVIANTSDLVERLAGAQRVVFDKTGTLSDDQLKLAAFVCVPEIPRDTLLAGIAAIEAASGHPIASAFRHIAPTPGVNAVRNLPGAGVEGRIGSEIYRIGNARLLPADPPSALRAQLPKPSSEARELYILRDGVVVGIARLREQLRVSSLTVIDELEAAGLSCAVLTGDETDRAHDLPEIETGLSPRAKADRIREMSATKHVLFVGDGVNDAPAMAEAHVSLSLASGSPLARETATGELADLRAIPFAIVRCRAAVRAIRQNLRFAIAYNLVGITLAAAGILHPVVAALLMLASSFTVSWRALRPVRLPLTPIPPSAPLVPQPA